MDDQHSDFRQWLAAQLEQSVPTLTEEWLDEVRGSLPVSSARRFPTELLREQVTNLLGRLFQALAADQDPAGDQEFSAGVGALTLFRRTHGFAKDELLVELELLSRGVFDKASELARSCPNAAEPHVVFGVSAQLRNSLNALSALTDSAFHDRDREDGRAWATLTASLIRIAVHELRNRVNAAMLRVELTLSHSHDAQASIDAALNLVGEAVDDLSRVLMVHGAQEPDQRTLPIENLIERVVEDLNPVARKAGVRVEALAPLPTFHIDAAKAYLVLLNLVGSAINHARLSRPPGTVELAAEALPARKAWRIAIAVKRPVRPQSPPESPKKESPSVVAARQVAALLGGLLVVNTDRRPGEPLYSLTVPEPPSELVPGTPFRV